MTRQMALTLTLAVALLIGCGRATTDTPTSPSPSPSDVSAPGGSNVRVETTLGEFVIAVDEEAAPEAVANFLGYVDSGFYDGGDGFGETTFHRVIPDFMIQGGGYKTNGNLKPPEGSIDHESDNGLLNLRGAVAMARTSEPDSATCQFFVNHVDNASLDYVGPDEPGYVVFGQVISGMDTVDAIATVETDASDVPLTPVVIEAVSRVAD